MDVKPLVQPKKAATARQKVFVRVEAPSAATARTMRTKVLRRDLVATPSKRVAKRGARRSSTRSKLLTAAAVGLCMLGVGVGWTGLRTNHKVEAQVRQLTQQSQQADASVTTASATTAPAVDIPSETKPNTSGPAYQVPPDHPKELKIPSLKVDASIIPVGILKTGDLATPGNIFDTGWYSSSALPGQGGAMLIDGHVSGPTQHGVFYNIKSLKQGDKISVVRGDGQTFTYTVVTSKVYDAGSVDMNAAMQPITFGKPGLNLITCTGKLDSTDTHFLQRVVVFAALE